MPKVPAGQQFWGNLFTTVLIFLILISAYSFFVEQRTKKEEVAISQLALQINAGEVSEIVVKGEDLEIVYVNGEERKSKKEVGTALTDTLVNYGVALDTVNEVTITIESPSGFKFWFFSLAPFLIPLIFIVFFLFSFFWCM